MDNSEGTKNQEIFFGGFGESFVKTNGEELFAIFVEDKNDKRGD